MLLEFSDWVVYEALGLSHTSRLAASLDFFVYDSLKIILLLYVMIFAIGVLRSFLPQNKIKMWMHKRGIIGNFFASVFGAVTPFCSCSSIPIFLSFLKAGIPLGVTFSFLVTSPLVNEYLVVIMLGFFGWRITALYVACGLLIGTVAGVILGRMRLEGYIVEDIASKQNEAIEDQAYGRFSGRLRFGLDEASSIVKKIWIWVLVGVGIGALIHNYVPEELIQSIVGRAGVFSVPIAVILGVPMYGSCAAIVPIAIVLFQKGMPLGVALAFMMAIAALSLPEAVMMRRAVRLKLILIFFGITATAIILIGYLFNMLQAILL